jgi:membrane fusion protein (multidrug efflux system)
MGLAVVGPVPAILEDELEPVKILVLCALLVAACWAVPVRAVELQETSFSVDGLLLPSAQAKLASRAKGVIEEIKREGDAVKAGDTVMRLESDTERLQHDQQRHILDLRSFERAASDELSEKSVISKTEVEEKRVNHEVAKVQLELAGRLFEMRKVVAPFDGVISERLRERGEAVDEFTPVITLVNLDELYLEVFLPAARLREVKVGAPVKVTVADLPGRDFQGVVAEVSPAVNPASGEFKVRVRVPNPRGELVAGTPAKAFFGSDA